MRCTTSLRAPLICNFGGMTAHDNATTDTIHNCGAGPA